MGPCRLSQFDPLFNIPIEYLCNCRKYVMFSTHTHTHTHTHWTCSISYDIYPEIFNRGKKGFLCFYRDNLIPLKHIFYNFLYFCLSFMASFICRYSKLHLAFRTHSVATQSSTENRTQTYIKLAACSRPHKFALCVCVWIAFMCLVSRTSSQMIVTNVRSCEQVGYEDDKLFGAQKVSLKQSLNCTLYG